MRGRQLRFLRIGVSLLFFGTTSLLFLDFAGIVQPGASHGVLYPQFTPSLVRLLQGSLLAASSLLFLLLLTLLWGRVFCSSACPLGFLQDVLSRLAVVSTRPGGRRRFHYSRPRNRLRYGVLLAYLIGAVSGSVLLVGLLDPYGHFGRIMALLVRPVVLILTDLLAAVSTNLGSYVLPRMDLGPVAWSGALLSLAFLGLLGVAAARRGRWFCNTLCPVGTILGLLSRVSWFRIGIDGANCDRCGECANECKAGCIDLRSRSVDFSRCVACFDCIAACRESAIGYHRAGRAPAVRVVQLNRMSFPKALQDELRATVVDSSRRSFVGLSAGGLAGLGAGGAPADLDACTGANAPGAVPAGRRTPVVAPGARGIDHLRSACIACQLCVSSCPTRVLQPSLLELGGRSFLQPHLDFRIAFCDYECTRCGDVCPTQAIAGLTAKVKKRTKIGEVRLVEEYCIAVAGEKTCAACAEYCPTRAVRMAPNKDGGIRPKLDTPVCIGCGACEYACPAQPQKAIFVEGAQEHRKARPPRNFPMHHYRHPDGFPF